MKNIRILKDEPEFEAPDGMVLLGSSTKSKRRKRYRKGINQFVDISDQEFESYYLNPRLNVREYRRGRF